MDTEPTASMTSVSVPWGDSAGQVEVAELSRSQRRVASFVQSRTGDADVWRQFNDSDIAVGMSNALGPLRRKRSRKASTRDFNADSAD